MCGRIVFHTIDKVVYRRLLSQLVVNEAGASYAQALVTTVAVRWPIQQSGYNDCTAGAGPSSNKVFGYSLTRTAL